MLFGERGEALFEHGAPDTGDEPVHARAHAAVTEIQSFHDQFAYLRGAMACGDAVEDTPYLVGHIGADAMLEPAVFMVGGRFDMSALQPCAQLC